MMDADLWVKAICLILFSALMAVIVNAFDPDRKKDKEANKRNYK